MMAKGLWESLCAHLVDADNNDDDDAEKDDGSHKNRPSRTGHGHRT